MLSLVMMRRNSLGNGRVAFKINIDLQNSHKSHEELCKLAYALKTTPYSKVEVDFSASSFISSNLFAVLGCIFSEFLAHNASKNAIIVQGIHPTILEVIQKNGFCNHIGLPKIADKHNTTIPYKIFDVKEIDEYERYLTISLFSRKDLPKMTKRVSDDIRDSLLEIFKNVADHTESSKVYTCGQFFPKSNMLFFTIVDAGNSIPYNVKKYHEIKGKTLPEKCLAWAVESGNTTLDTDTPRGIGLSLIRDFVKLNEGSFFIVSGNETYEIQRDRDRYIQLSAQFPGTIVTTGFNLNDRSSYYISTEQNTNIIF